MKEYVLSTDLLLHIKINSAMFSCLCIAALESSVSTVVSHENF